MFMDNPFHQAFTAESSSAKSVDLRNSIVYLADSAVCRIKQIQKQENDTSLRLRISISGGGCSGFQYLFSLDNKQSEDDRIFELNEAAIICDTTSLDFVSGSTIEYVETLAGSAFQIQNPKAGSSCGCGVSFAPL